MHDYPCFAERDDAYARLLPDNQNHSTCSYLILSPEDAIAVTRPNPNCYCPVTYEGFTNWGCYSDQTSPCITIAHSGQRVRCGTTSRPRRPHSLLLHRHLLLPAVTRHPVPPSRGNAIATPIRRGAPPFALTPPWGNTNP
eukprot:Sspe_Gene.39500::Locus_19054_Transcript_1_1_Confidence_1.000_Length_1768::g.39500::m.39500